MHKLPEYTYVPGGSWPHPNRSADKRHGPVPPIPEGDWRGSAAYLFGFALFNGGYYWEAHEVWESLWHAHGRKGPTADLLKALIKLAAAGVKVREGQPRGVATHARRAGDLFASVRSACGPTHAGLDLDACEAVAADLADNPPADPGPPDARVSRVFAFSISPR